MNPPRAPGMAARLRGRDAFKERIDAMTKKSRTALLAALMIGAGSLTIAAPALAKKEEAAAAPKLSPAFQKAAYDAQEKLKANDLAGAETALATADAAAKSDDEVLIAAQLRLALEQTKLKASSGGDPQKFAAGMGALLPSINKLIDNPKTPAADRARFLEVRGNIYYDGQKYADAVSDYEKARAAGSTSDQLGLQIMKAKGESGDVDGAAAELQHQIDAQPAGQHVPDTWYRYILAKLVKAKKTADSVVWAQKLVAAYPTPANWRQWVGVYASSIAPAVKLDTRQRLDLLRLLRAAKALADENDYNEYAQATNDLGLYDETISVIDEGMANGKLQAKNPLATMLKTSSTRGLSIDKPIAAQETQAKASKNGDLLAQVGDAYLGRGDYAKAAEAYREALTKPFAKPTGAATKQHFNDADEVNTHLGIALALGGDKAAAKTAFAAVTGSPRADFARFWLTWMEVGSAG